MKKLLSVALVLLVVAGMSFASPVGVVAVKAPTSGVVPVPPPPPPVQK